MVADVVARRKTKRFREMTILVKLKKGKEEVRVTREILEKLDNGEKLLV